LSYGALIKSVLLAVVLSPFLAGLIGLVAQFVRGAQSVEDSAKVLIGLPFVGAVMLLLGGIPVIIGTAAVAGALTFIQRHVWSSPILLWAIAATCVATIPFFLGRYPNGDGGSMQSMVETIKAMFAASVATWCIIAALRPVGQI
jgi:hypothetical protein